MNGITIISIIKFGFGIIGIIFLMVAVGVSVSTERRKKDCTELISAKIVEVERSDTVSMDGLRTVSWYPVYEYWVDGQRVRKRSHVGSAREDFYVGQTVQVYVNPQNINLFYCPDEKTELVRNIFAGVGVLLIFLSIGIGFLGNMIM